MRRLPIILFLALAWSAAAAEIDPAAIGSLFGPVEKTQALGDGWLVTHSNGATTRLIRHGDGLIAQQSSGPVMLITRSGSAWRVQGSDRFIEPRAGGQFRVRGGVLRKHSGAQPAYAFTDRELIRAAQK